MANDEWFLRVAEPDLWDGTHDPNEAARELAATPEWSLFKCSDTAGALVILAAYYGWRSGRGPLVRVAYVKLSLDQLLGIGARVSCTPDNFTYGWPPEVAAAHFDLAPMDVPRTRRLLDQVSSEQLIQVPRVELLIAQLSLLRRPGCPDALRKSVGDRFRKLMRNEASVFDSVVAACKTTSVAPPTAAELGA